MAPGTLIVKICAPTRDTKLNKSYQKGENVKGHTTILAFKSDPYDLWMDIFFVVKDNFCQVTKCNVPSPLPKHIHVNGISSF